MKVRIYNQGHEIHTYLQTLFPEELQGLLKVYTTKEQAEQIQQRNAGALYFVLRHAKCSTSVPIGCPHCNNFQCRKGKPCMWDKYPEHLKHGPPASPVCARAVFGGLSLETTDNISFTPVNVILSNPWSDKERSVMVEFLQGHVEWAEIVQMLPVTATDWTVEKED